MPPPQAAPQRHAFIPSLPTLVWGRGGVRVILVAADGRKLEHRGLYSALAAIFAGAPPSALAEFALWVRGVRRPA